MDTPKPGDIWYRFDDYRAAHVDEFDNLHFGGPRLRERKFEVTKVTPKGAWVQEREGDFKLGAPRFILRSARKRAAYESKQLALESLVERKKHQARILQAQLVVAQLALALAQGELQACAPEVNCLPPAKSVGLPASYSHNN